MYTSSFLQGFQLLCSPSLALVWLPPPKIPSLASLLLSFTTTHNLQAPHNRETYPCVPVLFCPPFSIIQDFQGDAGCDISYFFSRSATQRELVWNRGLAVISYSCCHFLFLLSFLILTVIFQCRCHLLFSLSSQLPPNCLPSLGPAAAEIPV